MLGKVLNNQNEMKEKMDHNLSQDTSQQLEQNIDLGIPVSSLEGYYELEEKRAQPAYMSQMVFEIYDISALIITVIYYRKLKLNSSVEKW